MAGLTAGLVLFPGFIQAEVTRGRIGYWRKQFPNATSSLSGPVRTIFRLNTWLANSQDVRSTRGSQGIVREVTFSEPHPIQTFLSFRNRTDESLKICRLSAAGA